MKAILIAALTTVALGACTTPGQQTSWGKAGVSKLDYGTDVGMCTGTASLFGGDSGVNTAGGISGSNNAPPPHEPGRGSQELSPGGGPPPASQAATSSSLPASGNYSGTVSQDYAQRAANQQRSQEMLAKRARADALKGCLTQRGYQEFTLTAEQRAHLATLKTGSNEYHEYLYSLGSDPAVVGGATAK
jgi:hypothetical protein